MTWAALAGILAAVLKVLLPALANMRATQETAARQAGLRARLSRTVRDRWADVALPVVCVVLLACGAGCIRTVYVPHGEPVRLRETVKRVKIWSVDADGKAAAGVMDLPEGWYALPVDPNSKE